MNDRDKPRFAEILFALGKTFAKPVDDELVAIYWGLISPRLDLATFESAAGRVMISSEFFPKPVDLLRQHDFDHEALVAWETVNRAMARYGSYRSVDFGPEINATIRSLGGWVEFGKLSIRDEKWYRKDFEKTFKSYRSNGVSEEAGQSLDGIGEATSVTRDGTGRVTETKNEPVRIETTPTRKRIG